MAQPGGALPAKDPVQQQLCVPGEPLMQHLHQHLAEHLLRLQDVQEIWEFGVGMESDSAGSKVPNPSALPWQSCAWGRLGCRV